MLEQVLPSGRTISRDGIIQYVNPSTEDLTPLQEKHNEWLRRKAPVNQLHQWQFTDMWDRLFATLELAGGCGLSANQIGFPARAFVMKTSQRSVKVYEPVILEVSNIECAYGEGCLSLDGIDVADDIQRPGAIVVEYFNGEEVLREGLVGIEARVFQHEYDHLNGFIFTDHLVIQRNLRKQLLLTAGEFEPTYLQYESRVAQDVHNKHFGVRDVDDNDQFIYIDPASDMLRTTPGNFRQRLLRLIDERMIKTIEAW